MRITLPINGVDVDNDALDILDRVWVEQLRVLESGSISPARADLCFGEGIQQVLEVPIELPESLMFRI